MKRVILGASLLLVGGCYVRVGPPVVAVAPAPVYVEPAPAPAVAVVEEAPPAEIIAGGVIVVEPAIELRTYVYDPFYPPGCYFYGGFYWYGGRRYEQDFFRERFVGWNREHGRYAHADENRRFADRIREDHRRDYAVHHGVNHGQAHGQPHAEHGRPGEEHRSNR